MCKSFEIYKCRTLILMLIKRNQNPERAKECYSEKIYKKALKQLEIENGYEYIHNPQKTLTMGFSGAIQGVLI